MKKPTIALLTLGLLVFAPAALNAAEADPTLDLRLKAVSANPNEPRNHFNLGVEYMNREMYDQASASFQKALNTNRKDAEAHKEIDLDCYQALGQIMMSLQRFPDAERWFRDGLKFKPDDAVCQFGQGQAYYYGKKYNQARETLQKYVDANGQNPKAAKECAFALTAIGDIAMAQKKYPEAAAAFRSLIAKYPSQGKEARQNLGVVLLTQGDEFTKRKQYVEAAKMYDEAAAADPTSQGSFQASARAHYELGVNASASKNAEEKKGANAHFTIAAKNFHKATILDKNDFESAYFEGLSRYYLEQWSDMIGAYQKAISINASHGGARYNLALALYRQGQFEEAKKEAEEAVKLQPGDPSSIQLVARVHDAAIEDLLKKGTEAYTAERFGEAITAWEKVLALDPHNQEAKQYLDQAKTRVGQAVQEHIAKGEQAYEREDVETAFSEWNTALALDPQNAEVAAKLAKVGKVQQVAARRKLANAAFQRGDIQVALSELEAALALNPRDAQSLKLKKKILSAQKADLTGVITKAKAAMNSGRLSVARREAERAREMAPGNKEVTDLLISVNKRIDDSISRNMSDGREAVRSGNRSSAVKSFQAVLALDPTNQEAATQVKSLTGKESTVKVSAEKIKELRKRGINAYLMGRLDEAQKAWEQVLEYDSENAEIKRYLERVKLKLKGTAKTKNA
jgi:tetratricopeptide (TPR) repeat protein